MNLEKFKEQVSETVDLYLSDYFTFTIEWDFDDPESPHADVAVEILHDRSHRTWNIPISLDEYGEPGVEASEGNFLPLDGFGIMTALFFETNSRLDDAY